MSLVFNNIILFLVEFEWGSKVMCDDHFDFDESIYLVANHLFLLIWK